MRSAVVAVDKVLTFCSVYQDFLATSLTEKYSTLSSQMDKVIEDANSEISNLRGKLDGEQCTQSLHDTDLTCRSPTPPAEGSRDEEFTACKRLPREV